MTDLPRFPAKSRRPCFKQGIQWALLILACGWVPAHAQSCSDVCELYRGLLQVTERTLVESVRPLEKITKPVVGPRNTRGRWVQRGAYLGQEVFDTTFYLKSGLVQRIELVSTAPDVHCRSRAPWAAAIAALEAWQGNEVVKGQLEIGDSVQQSAHWSESDVDVSVYLFVSDQACSTKVAFKKRDVKDATVL